MEMAGIAAKVMLWTITSVAGITSGISAMFRTPVSHRLGGMYTDDTPGDRADLGGTFGVRLPACHAGL